MKILLIGFSKIKYMPYVNFYLDTIDRSRHDVHLLYWNRDLKPEDYSAYHGVTLHEFSCYQEDNIPPARKIGSFIKYIKYSQKVLKENKFDFAVALHSMPAVLLSHFWIKRFKNRFIFDYRDSTYERFGLYKKIINKLIESSRLSFTSSDGFRKFFSDSLQSKVYTSHNVLADSLLHRDIEKKTHDRIQIAFWGFIREENLNREIIRKLAADLRFELHYYGREQTVARNLKKFAKEIRAENVFFHGEYSPADRYEFVKNTDLIHNIYCDDNMMLAMGNKYYDGAVFCVPQLCMKGAFMGTQVENKEIGFACDPFQPNFSQTIYEYYTQLDRGGFVEKCNSELARIIAEYQDGKDVLKQIWG